MSHIEQNISALCTPGLVAHLKRCYQWTNEVTASLAWAYKMTSAADTVSLERKSKFVARTLLNLKPSLSWYQFVRSSYLRQLVGRDANLLDVIHRPFFDRNLGAMERVNMLACHFELLHSLLGAKNTADIVSGHRFLLSRFTGKNEEHFTIHLLRDDAFKREGGLTLALSMNDETLLYVTFTLVKNHHGNAIKVGGIQSNRGNCRQLARTATNALHGIQPRLLLIDVLRNLASQIHCTTIECVSKENHIHRAWRYRLKKCIHAEYDQLWLLAGGYQNWRGNFEIPPTTDEKPIESRPSNKRSEYRRRAALTEAMRAQMHAAIHERNHHLRHSHN
ncbi:DUF535 family protein [Undibacterium sp. FT147W]|uniref:DUF535 family protein n=1 Tax=Undibacterium rivi TaxID=2828729 RepID=A0ABS5H5W9_9BURK|nr:DUF535 family protein [Undibacterium rivi]MBR7793965.1 DUF535 family protein [Undibacterium rivi]